MNKKTYISLVANGEVCGFPSEVGIAHINGETTVVGRLNTKGKVPTDLIQSKELGIDELSRHLTVLPKNGTDFTVSFIRRPGQSAFSLTSGGILCGILTSRDIKQMLLIVNTANLKNGNDFEKSVASAAEWAKISELTLIIQNRGGHDYSLLQKLSNEFGHITIPNGYETYQLIASGIFDLSQTDFGKCVSDLTNQNKLLFAAGGSFKEKSFGVQLMSEKIETNSFIIENLLFGIQKSTGGFYCVAAGTFIFKLENGNFGFTLSGAVSPKSFILSATSLPDARIPLNSRLSFSDLALSIGIDAGKPSFGMTGRLNTNNLSVFAGFVVSPPRISLFTAALTSTKGRISLKDLVVEIADIDWDAVDCLDVVAIGDFDIQDTSLTGGGIKDFPENNNEENYQETKKSIETSVKNDFNGKMGELKITGDAQLTPLGNNTGQYILTDKGTMRHYRIDRNGKISLNCQVYFCTQPVKLGNYDMPIGIFICGTLEIFGIRTRFLFLADKGKSLIALVQMDKINILNGLFVLDKSEKPLPVNPIDGGIAGQLVRSDNKEGATMYLNIQKDKGEVTFYVSARISLLKIFNFDTLILIKDRLVYINVETEYAGFKTTWNLQGSYKDFASAGFTASVVFDTSGFQKILEEAQRKLKDAAKSVQKNVEEATRKLEEAQRSVLNLQNKIKEYNDRIKKCKREISKAKWYQIGKKIARGLEIAGLEIAKAGVYVAIGVAYAALEVAKAALNFGGALASTVLESIAYVISAVTQILWIKSFELGIITKKEMQMINAKLTLTVFGKDISLEEELNLTGLIHNITNFVSEKIKGQSDNLIKDIKEGKVTKAIDATLESDEYQTLVYDCRNLKKNKERYEELSMLREATEGLFISSNNAYFDAFHEEHPDIREDTCNLTNIRWEEETLHKQHCDAFDNEFVESLENVIRVVKQNQTKSRAVHSETKEDDMDILLDIVKGIQAEQVRRTQRYKENASLFTRMEKSMEVRRSVRRPAESETETSAKEANEQYANSLSSLIEQHLGNQKGEVAEELKRELGIALYQFRNPENTFRKHNNNNNEDDDEDFE